MGSCHCEHSVCFLSWLVPPFIAWDALLHPTGVLIEGQTWSSSSQRICYCLVVQRVPQEQYRSSSQYLRHESQSRCTSGFPLENPRTKYVEGEPARDNVSTAVSKSHKLNLLFSPSAPLLESVVNVTFSSYWTRNKFVGHQDGNLTDGSQVTFTLGDIRSMRD